MPTEIIPHESLHDHDYEAALGELLKLEFFGMKLGLQNITTLTESLGHPERSYPTIHIAGTNGKGSVAATLAAIYQASGKKVGLYTSPHLVDFRERMKVNGEMVSREFLKAFLERIWPIVLTERATFFEVTTAAAFEYFREMKVDIAIIETGLGGRLDATNILERPLASVVTSIGWDHMQQLGNSLHLIAGEKAGIFKRGVPAIVNAPVELHEVFERRAAEVGAPIFFVHDGDASIPVGLSPAMPGEHQRMNLRTVLEVLRHVPDSPNQHAIAAGVAQVQQLSGFRSRLEEYSDRNLEARGVRLLLDVGHNRNAFEALRDYFLEQQIRPIVVAGIMQDKDVAATLAVVRQFADRFIAVQAPTKRALASSELTLAATAAGLTAVDGGEVMAGLATALRAAARGSTILLGGSHYVVGEFLANDSAIQSVV